MDAQEYRAALTTLGLSQLAAGRWLGVSNKTAQRYASDGPSGSAARAMRLAVGLVGLKVGGWDGLDELTVRHADVMRVLDLGK